MMATATCTYCDRLAVSGGYIQPAMCERHHDLALVISWLSGNGRPVTAENVRVLVSHYRPRLSVQPDEVESLLAAMQKERVLDGER